MLSVLDLFSGIGGFSLGLERTGGFKTVAFCEIEPFPRAVLAKHWPEVPCYDDVRTLTAERLAADGISVDVICGGFPCQDISVAGRGAGLGGARSGLWFDMLRVIAETQPRWVVAENVSALRTRGLDIVLRGLAALGYDAEWHCIPAGAIGAAHQRDRVWIVAHPASGGRREHGDERRQARHPQARQSADGCAVLANAERGGHEGRSTVSPDGEDASPALSCDPARSQVISASDIRDAAAQRIWGRAQPGLGGEANGLSRWMDGTRPVEAWEGNTPRVVPPGYPNRRPRLKALGNSVVPQIPELIGRAILRAEGLEALHAA
ncbi:C-5 cytosine-specific DNA methylase [Acetobacteraceae bacterium AT-5844]|nr:C-5 cytosine-specific DNA methylase [Acetobacteraceae bacterium AT-5844]